MRCQHVARCLTLALASSGCGYALAGRGSFLPDYIRIVGIPPIENRSTFLQVEQVLTEKIRTEFIGRGKYTVVSEASGADAVLTGEIIGISAQPVGFNEQQLASRYLFIMTMKVQLTDARTSMVLWSNDALTFREESELTSRSTTRARRRRVRRSGAQLLRSHRHRRRAHRRHGDPRGVLSCRR